MPFNFRKTLMLRLAILSIILLSASSFAADVAVKGYLIDVACSARKANKPASLATHNKGCMQMPTCNNSGFGIVTEDKQFIKFDDEGNEKARKFISETKADHDFKVTVS